MCLNHYRNEVALLGEKKKKTQAHYTRVACKLHKNDDYTWISYSFSFLYLTKVLGYSSAPMYLLNEQINAECTEK